MPGYVGTLIDIEDLPRFGEYIAGVGPTLTPFGGRVALRGPVVGVVEGHLDVTDNTRLVMLEFDSLQLARDWYESAEYQALIPLREEISTTTAFFLDGARIGGEQP
jgi:uncharacterized protein (DUF1330 family)